MTTDAAPAITFSRDIRPLFREFDVKSMQKGGLDLSSYEQVNQKADAILKILEAGKMPCDGPWPAKDIATFKQWISGGKLP
jgi:hypothetical protein